MLCSIAELFVSIKYLYFPPYTYGFFHFKAVGLVKALFSAKDKRYKNENNEKRNV